MNFGYLLSFRLSDRSPVKNIFQVQNCVADTLGQDPQACYGLPWYLLCGTAIRLTVINKHTKYQVKSSASHLSRPAAFRWRGPCKSTPPPPPGAENPSTYFHSGLIGVSAPNVI